MCFYLYKEINVMLTVILASEGGSFLNDIFILKGAFLNKMLSNSNSLTSYHNVIIVV